VWEAASVDDGFVSVIMPVRNEERLIALSLNAVLHQTYPAERIEILVVDGESEDGTLAAIRSMPEAERVRVLHNPRRIQAAGMNLGLREVRGDIIVRVDGHTVIAPDYVQECVRALRETGADGVGGAMIPVGVSQTGKAIAAATRTGFAVPGAFRTDRTGRYTDTVYMGAWPRAVLDRVGGFDERFPINEDYELHYRIRQGGGRIYLAPGIRSHYFGRQTFSTLARQYFRYGRAKTSILRKVPRSLRPRQLVAPAFVACLVAGALFSAFSPPILFAWLGMLLAYLALNLGFSLRAALRTGRHLLWRIPLAFMTVHLAWGSGFWVGLMRGEERPAAAQPAAMLAEQVPAASPPV
jgi:succinoglycan biosynthesis protein ExoA